MLGVDRLGVIVVAGLEAPKENVVGRTFGFVALAAEAKDTDAKGFDLVAGVDDLSGVAEAAEEGARTGPLPLENCLRLPIHRYKMGPKMVTWLEQIKISQIQKKNSSHATKIKLVYMYQWFKRFVFTTQLTWIHE